ncbi:MAG: hypothetical protein WCK35_18855 [Chloroflexota bacterium]
MNNILSFKVSIPTQDGFVGRECNNPSCKKYFQVFTDSLDDAFICPYCGTESANSELWTSDQKLYIQQVAEEKAKEYALAEIDKMFGNFARKMRSNKFIKIKHTPTNYRVKHVIANYSEKKVDTELICPECNFRFQVYGIFGYCPKCRTENIKIYDANLAIILKEISESQDSQRALRHAYSDLVSTFEQFCRKKALTNINEIPRFQNLKDTRDYFKKHISKDIYSGIAITDQNQLRKTFLKRHLYEHNGGIVNARYIQSFPEDRGYLDQLAPLSEDELFISAQILRRILGNLI